jgi:hypothetical protein
MGDGRVVSAVARRATLRSKTDHELGVEQRSPLLVI